MNRKIGYVIGSLLTLGMLYGINSVCHTQKVNSLRSELKAVQKELISSREQLNRQTEYVWSKPQNVHDLPYGDWAVKAEVIDRLEFRARELQKQIK